VTGNKAHRGSFRIAIIGPGRLGQALGKLLAEAGFPVTFVVARRLEVALRAARFIGRGRAVRFSETDQWMKAQVVLLTVTDAALPEVIEYVADPLAYRGDKSRLHLSHFSQWAGKVVLHTCGSLPSSVLRPLKHRGAVIGSLHPFQTIPDPATGFRTLRSCLWAIEGDRKAVRVAAQWIRALRGKAFRVRPERKTDYHLAAFLVCPTVVTLMDQSLRLLKGSGVPPRVARPMLSQFVAQTARNFAALGARRALTGPAARGDWSTIHRHVAVLRRSSPQVLPVYAALVRAMSGIAKRKVPSSLKKLFASRSLIRG
jgi:predicted short-subunit dehydrogenase-like oxidoreductase (DUF2520 family)